MPQRGLAAAVPPPVLLRACGSQSQADQLFRQIKQRNMFLHGTSNTEAALPFCNNLALQATEAWVRCLVP